MTINIIQTITNTLTENRELISSKQSEGYVLIPDEGKMLKNKFTRETFINKIYIYQKSAISDYIEVDIPKEKEN